MISHMLTTDDNPFDPWDQFNEWHARDMVMGYHTLALLARCTRSSTELSEADQALAVEWAMEEIVRENVSGHHERVAREFAESST